MSAQDQLEQIIDSDGLKHVLEAIAEICHLKAEHLRANWQDARSASVWERDGKRIDRTAARITVL